MSRIFIICVLLITFSVQAMASEKKTTPSEPQSTAAMAASIAELSQVIGTWDVTTRFFNSEGETTQSVQQTYTFSWVIPNQLVQGQSHTPAWKQTSAILFFIDQEAPAMEMVSVGVDGKLWRMRGPLGGNQRFSQSFTNTSGDTAQLRFTRSLVTPNGFESRMYISTDGGNSWLPGNHQVFIRRSEHE